MYEHKCGITADEGLVLAPKEEEHGSGAHTQTHADFLRDVAMYRKVTWEMLS